MQNCIMLNVGRLHVVKNKNKEYSTKEVLHIIKRAVKIDFKMWLCSVLGAFITAVPWFITILLSGILMKQTVSAASESRQIWDVVLLMVGILIILRVPNIIGYGVNSWASEHISGKLQEKMIQRWLSKEEKTLEENHTGDIMARITNDCAVELSDFYFQGFGLKVIEPFVTGCAAIITVYIIDIRLAVFSLIMGVCSTFVAGLFSQSIQQNQVLAQKGQAQVSESISNILYGVETIKLFQLKKQQLNRLEDNCETVRKYNRRVCEKTQLVRLCGSLFELLTIGGCLLLGAIYSDRGDLYFPDIMIVLQMQSLIGSLVSGIGGAWNYLVEESVYFKRVFDILDYKEETQRADKGDIKQKNKDIMIECEGLSFGYEKDKPVLKGINFKIRYGQKIAIIGESGCGKSTLLKILTGMYMDFEGELKMMGTNFKDCTLKSWRRQITIVPQEKSLFNRTIAENISLGYWENEKRQSETEIEEASQKAGIYEYVTSLPNGYQTIVGEMGDTLSGGQQQRIAIARSFFRTSPLLLLDEVTSSLDAESERIIQEALDNLMENRTVIIITHKYSIIRNADLIITMEDGRITECGTHEALINKGGYYSRMYQLQNGSL